MEGSLEQSKQVEHIFLTDIFNELCPFFISIGMTYKEFWFEDVEIAQMYLQAYIQKEKRETEKTEWTIWRQGLYIYEAFCDVAPILRPFSKAKKPLPYPSKPHGFEDKEKEEQRKKEQEKVDLMRVQIFFEHWAKNTAKHFKGENNG